MDFAPSSASYKYMDMNKFKTDMVALLRIVWAFIARKDRIIVIHDVRRREKGGSLEDCAFAHISATSGETIIAAFGMLFDISRKLEKRGVDSIAQYMLESLASGETPGFKYHAMSEEIIIGDRNETKEGKGT
jgi:hypothetical protein